ncbi:MAG: DUF3179 domain-containing protein [Phycisphaerales bacterium]|nr:MAG: DUF3179 domain-containing protein [Phycisphaerales bacterium]
MTFPGTYPDTKKSAGKAKRPERLFTFKAGGWIVLISALVMVSLAVWAIAPAIYRATIRPPGDGRTIESYQFDLSNLTVSRDTIVPALLHRDMVPVMEEPEILTAAEVQRIAEEERGKFLVSTDRVVGVEINGEARAYPLMLLNVHEVILDTLGGVPIAVTYSWTSDSFRVFDRRMDDEVLTLGVSGLLWNANTLLYDRRPPQPGEEEVPHIERGESLWSQITTNAIAGPASDHERSLRTIPFQFVSWQQWREMHRETTVVARQPHLIKRYRRASPDTYFEGTEFPYPAAPMPDDQPEIGLGRKDRVLVLWRRDAPDERVVYPLQLIADRAEEISSDHARWTHEPFEGIRVTFDYEGATRTVRVQSEHDLEWTRALWFAWHAAHPDDHVIE